MITQNKIYLASGSPRRLELLKNLNCRVAQIKVPFEEPKVSNFKDPLAFMRLCLQQKKEQAESYFWDQKEIHNEPSPAGYILLVADTVVAAGSQILGKPLESIDAFHMLGKLSGREHQVYTAYSLWITCAQVQKPRFFKSQTVISTVRFKKLSKAFIQSYIRSKEPLDKAGAYGVQGMGLQMIDSIEGSYSSVMGLPLLEVMHDLRALETFLQKEERA